MSVVEVKPGTGERAAPISLAIVGASGRVGLALVRLCAADSAFRLTAAVGRQSAGEDAGARAGVGPTGVVVESGLDCLARSGAQVVIDFSTAAAFRDVVTATAHAGAAFVSGTTGLDADDERALAEAAKRVPVLWEPNMSVGVHVLGELVRRAILAMGPEFDIEIVEAHHRKKEDAPSGTALRLAEIARSVREESAFVFGRSGKPGPRPDDEIGVHAVRGGDVVGDHTVSLLGLGERLELTHRASNRDLFAQGALRAARWIAAKPPRRYRLVDMLG